jgi:hypothetical protein
MAFHGWISTICSIIGCVIVVATFIVKVNKDREGALIALRKEIEASDKEIKKENEESHRRIHARMDKSQEDHNLEMERMRKEHSGELQILRSLLYDQYVSSKMCSQIHTSTNSSIAEIKQSVDRLFDKFDEFYKRMADNKVEPQK